MAQNEQLTKLVSYEEIRAAYILSIFFFKSIGTLYQFGIICELESYYFITQMLNGDICFNLAN